ncbi:MAG: glycosyltransferase [Rubrobacter sp.]|nr:glycosyltransferase [Rubrobacter sp.]
MRGAEVRVDLHLHSWASGSATNVWVRGLGDAGGVRESYTPPEDAYRMAKRAGMDFVTLTDHETIDGALALAHHPDFFVSEEVSARFPEEDSSVDVLVYGLDEEIHAEAQARRGSVYDLVDYLREAGVVHALAHPIYDLGGSLDRSGIEKRLVLFGLWEFVNGSRPPRQNRLAREIAEGIGVLDLRRMALWHGFPTPPHRRIRGIAGSDDYGGATHTVAPGVRNPREFLDALAAGEVRPAGEEGSVGKFVQTAFRLAGAALEGGREDRAAGLLRRLGLPDDVRVRLRAASATSENALLRYLPILARLDEARMRSSLASRYENRVREAFEDSGLGSPALDFLGSVGGFVDGHVFIAPYVAAHGYFGREAGKARKLREELWLGGGDAPPRIAVFVDGMNEVPAMYRGLGSPLDDDLEGRLRFVTCGSSPAPGVASMRPVTHVGTPLNAGSKLGVPSLLEVLEHVAEEDYAAIHVTTPGPLGLAALVCGLVLGVPVVGSYSADFAGHAHDLFRDEIVARVVEVAVREFYERCSVVAVPSPAAELDLRERGYRVQRFEVVESGVDGELYAPSKRAPALREALGDGGTLLLYAGRLDHDAGLNSFVAGYRNLRKRRSDVRLVVAGDGPYRREIQDSLGDTASFVGSPSGEALARLFASCDVFVSPGAKGASGRAVIEAQSSGLPVVLFAGGGWSERIRPGVSGFAVPPGDQLAFFEKIELLLDDAWLRQQMSHAAREHAASTNRKALLDVLTNLHSPSPRPVPHPHAVL